MAQIEIKQGAKKLFGLHFSGKNRAERRQDAWQEAHFLQSQKEYNISQMHDLHRKQRMTAARERGRKAHDRAVMRRIEAKKV